MMKLKMVRVEAKVKPAELVELAELVEPKMDHWGYLV